MFRAMYIFLVCFYLSIYLILWFSCECHLLSRQMHKNRQSNRSHAKAGDPDAVTEVTAFFLKPEACWSAASRRVAQHFVVERVTKRQYEEESKRATWSVGSWRAGLRVRSERGNRLWVYFGSRIDFTNINDLSRHFQWEIKRSPL